jgi:DegV family protein with EDD domain
LPGPTGSHPIIIKPGKARADRSISSDIRFRYEGFEMTVGLVSTSVSALPREKVLEYGIKVVPVPFSLDGHTYLDGVDIPSSQIYELMAYELPFRTSAPAPGDYLDAFNEVGNHAMDVLCLTISRKFSMMYSTASAASREFSRPDHISVVDTGTAAAGQALIDIAVARAIERGAGLEECIGTVERMKSRVYLYGLIRESKYLARTGRVPSLLPRTASLIGIKPIIGISRGAARLVKLVRTSSSGVNHMLSMMRDKVGDRTVKLMVQHANAREDAECLKERVESEFSCSESFLSEFSPVMGYATGPGTLVLAFTTDEE